MECERTNISDPLRQGDIIVAQPASPDWCNIWTRFGIIITADCDITNRKSQDVLAYIPFLPRSTWLYEVWLKQEVNEFANRCLDKIDNLGSKLESALERRHMFRWRVGGVSGDVSENLQKIRDSASGSAVSIVDEIEKIWILYCHSIEILGENKNFSHANFKVTLGELWNASDKAGMKQRKKKDAILSALESNRSRIDSWYLAEIIGHDFDMFEYQPYGFIADMRRISSISYTKIVLDKSVWYGEADKYARICRLRGIYKSDLLQRFSHLFSRVGLEDQRERAHKSMLERCSAQMGGSE